MRWIYDEPDKVWLSGNHTNGIGVLQGESKQWYANVVINSVTHVIGPYKSAEEAMDYSEIEYSRLQANKNYDDCIF